MTAEDRAKYGQTRTLCEFMTNIAYAMETSGGLDQGLSDRMDAVVEPIRMARDWMWFSGQLMSQSKPLPSDFHQTLEVAEGRALEALPKLRALIDEACEALALAAQKTEPASARAVG